MKAINSFKKIAIFQINNNPSKYRNIYKDGLLFVSKFHIENLDVSSS